MITMIKESVDLYRNSQRMLLLAAPWNACSSRDLNRWLEQGKRIWRRAELLPTKKVPKTPSTDANFEKDVRVWFVEGQNAPKEEVPVVKSLIGVAPVQRCGQARVVLHQKVSSALDFLHPNGLNSHVTLVPLQIVLPSNKLLSEHQWLHTLLAGPVGGRCNSRARSLRR